MRKWFGFLLFCVLWTGSLRAAMQSSGAHYGYTDDLESEQYELIEEVVPLFVPEKKELLVSSAVFDKELSKEFKRRYEDDFGRTQSERNYFEPNKYSFLSYGSTQYTTLEQNFEKQRKFGEYVLRRLTEHHLDNYAKSNEGLRKVYEVKERISNAQVAFKKGYKLKIRYSLSADTLDFNLLNPLDLDARVTVFMDQPGTEEGQSYTETQVSVGYEVKPGTRLSTYYKIQDHVAHVVAEREIGPSVTASVTGITYTSEKGITTRERAMLFGVTWLY